MTMKFFTRKMAKDPTQQDELKLRLLKQQIAASETHRILGQITEQEYLMNMERCENELRKLEEKYGMSDKQ